MPALHALALQVVSVVPLAHLRRRLPRVPGTTWSLGLGAGCSMVSWLDVLEQEALKSAQDLHQRFLTGQRERERERRALSP